MARRIRHSQPIIFDLRGDDELEDRAIRAIHFYIGDDDESDSQSTGKLSRLKSQMMNP